ncbi:MAG: 2-dehydropantoate 2-reductase [Planctomycetes bacterium]|nr:2-dehydropantoate 2-reductase [Planctomycetota bacterium]
MDHPKVAIIGPGAIGLLLAARIRSAGVAVTLVDRNPARAARIRERGIRVEEPDGRVTDARVDVVVGAPAGRTFDIAFVAVKSFDTEGAAAIARRLLAGAGILVSLQNGVAHLPALGSAWRPERTVVGSTTQGATLLDAGSIRYAGGGETVVGTLSGARDAPGAVAALLTRAGLPARVDGEIRRILWEKLVANCAINPVAAILRIPNGALLRDRAAQRVMARALAEARRVARQRGIQVRTGLAKVLEICAATRDNRCSLFQDLERGSRCEIDVLNGFIAAEAARMGVPAPVHRALAWLVRAIEAVRGGGGTHGGDAGEDPRAAH